MKVKIEELKSEDRVMFSSEFGSAQAAWSGSTPKVGNEYIVEVDLEGSIVFGKNLAFSN
ncbi:MULTISPECIES: hypothetical protein [Saccharibacillus]|uniref:hypothetical protein n=1 Tax=Saccharibacillus TaxID=456492 RepID=UPI001311F87F|nr:hypothetical protein [Saccharibacillus sp. WB 17]MWJ31901.1 hypothetical protein [Saccharibacillus sp. WB 17]